MGRKSKEEAFTPSGEPIAPPVNPRVALQALRAKTAGKGSLRVIDMILDRPTDVISMTLTEFADTVQVSDSLIIKILKNIKLSGFQSLKLSLSQYVVSPTHIIHDALVKGDGCENIIKKIFGANVQALIDTEAVLRPDLLQRAVEILKSAKKIEIYGIGSAAPIAEDAHYRLMRIGMETRVTVDSHMQVATASLATPDTAVLTISHSGSTIDTLTATRLAKEAGAKVVVITGYRRSPLHKYADIALQTMAVETKFRTEAMTSRIAQLSIVDALVAALALFRHDKAVKTLDTTFHALASKRV